MSWQPVLTALPRARPLHFLLAGSGCLAGVPAWQFREWRWSTWHRRLG